MTRVSRQHAALFKQRHRKGGKEKLDNFSEALFALPKRSAQKRSATDALPCMSPPEPKLTKFSEETRQLTYNSLLSDCRVLTQQLESKEKECSELKKHNKTLAKSNEKLQNENKKLNQKITAWCPKRLNFKLSSSTKCSAMWRKKYCVASKELAWLRQNQNVTELQRQLQQSNREKTKLKRIKRRKRIQTQNNRMLKEERLANQILQETVKKLHKAITSRKERELYYQTEMAVLQENQDACPAPLIIQTKQGNSFTPAMRTAIYKCISCQVPVERVSSVLDHAVRILTPHQLDDLPSVSTICGAAREMGILSDLQVATKVTSCDNMTLAWDGTSLDGKHINEVHLCTSQGPLVLGVSQLPDGRASSYYSNITEVLADTVNTYSQYSGKDAETLGKSLKNNISNTLSDRAATNHAVVEKLSGNFFGKSLNELNCNVHPLDSVAISACETLRKCGIPSATFGNEGAATNVIKAISKMRYKAGRGDPAGFRHLLQRHNIPAKLLPR